MKKIFYLLMLGATSLPVAAQVLANGNVINSGITNSNVFFDASTTFSNEAGSGANVGKGLVIPSVDLVNFQFDLTLADGFTFPTFFDGMIVYNNATGTTLTAGNRSSTATLVSPGYYFFFNPNGGTNQTVQPGVWRPLGGDPKFNVVNAAAAGTATNTLVDGAQVYAYKGQFTTTGSSTAVTIAPPTGLTSMYGITIFKRATTGNKVVFSKELYSYNSTTGAAVTGSPSMSVVYPADTYDYIIEYFK
ncbi:hypothetical protein ASG22_08645 [Chryseobacterium sp. Leaf405]|uniref:hypothetical protein n=1 Tax=Chryseobacterium sp. Leaf405 TaxID=1736367 RepID=UPI0006FE0FC1|nr:hypothetical protein [Chryseobacterium sp. Leaf405]KQT24078.1 hypothetical protein ASG22_08645 [Chryseobacterium sp. Leaf405]